MSSPASAPIAADPPGSPTAESAAAGGGAGIVIGSAQLGHLARRPAYSSFTAIFFSQDVQRNLITKGPPLSFQAGTQGSNRRLRRFRRLRK